MAELDRERNLHTPNGDVIPELKMDVAMFLDKTIAIYGPSGTGKTVIAKSILHKLRRHAEQIIVVSPTESANHSYEGIVDPTLIHPRPYLPDPAKPKKDAGNAGVVRFLNSIWDRQMMMRAVYGRANDPKILASLFARLPREVRHQGQLTIKTIYSRRCEIIDSLKQQHRDDPGRCSEKIKEVSDKLRAMLVAVYKRYITPYYNDLYQKELSEDEMFSLTNLQFNPRLVLVFDDCAADLKAHFNKDVFRRLFYQGRWASLTTIIMAQDDTDIPANLRKNAFVSFFTTPIVCSANFERSANQFSKDTKRYVAGILESVFVGNRKIAYIREDPLRKHFYHAEVQNCPPFRFGSTALAELCDDVRADGPAMDKENPYYEKFKTR